MSDGSSASESARPTSRAGGASGSRTYAPDFLLDLFRNPLEPGYADATARRRQLGAGGGRSRTGRTLSAVVLVAIGFLLAVAYRQTVAEEPGRSQARAGLLAQIKLREAETDRLAGRAAALRDEVARQRQAALSGSEAAQLRDLEMVTGLARVRGDGVVVRVADAAVEADAVTGAGEVNLGRVLDRDLQDIANTLWSAGAEAIAINGQRLTATSTIRAAGAAILVDFRPVTGPYEVSAVGPEQMLRRFRGSATARLLRTVSAEHGMSFDVRAADDLVLPAGAGPQLRYAQPLPSATPLVAGSGRSTSPVPSGPGRSIGPTGGS